MSAPLQILLLEDSLADAELTLHELCLSGFKSNWQRVETEADYLAQLHPGIELILADYSLPQFNALRALQLLQERGLDIPFIVITGTVSEEVVVECMKQGAADYLLKDRLMRLGSAVAQALQAKQMRDQKRQTEAEKTRLIASSQESEQRFRALIENATDIIIIVNASGQVTYVSPSVNRILGYAPDGLLGKNALTFIHPEDVLLVKQRLKNSIQNPNVAQRLGEYRVQHCNGSWGIFEAVTTNLLKDPAVQGIVVNCHDITERKQAEEQLRHHAFYDSLCGLPNRTLFLERLASQIKRSQRQKDSLFAVLFLDLDRFEMVKYSLGHLVSDQLLIATARKLMTCLCPTDTLARIGTDEFAILLEDIHDVSDAIRVVEQIQRELNSPFNLDGREVFTTTSIGIAFAGRGQEGWEPVRKDAPISLCPSAPSHSNLLPRPQDLLRAADTAMYHARLEGKGRYVVFHPAMHTLAVAHLQLETDLRRAIIATEFQLYYQPIVELATGKIKAFEALVRWNHPTRGMVPPSDFIPAAEETGLIIPLGTWVLDEACRQLKVWQQQYSTTQGLAISVNLSAKQFSQPNLIEQIDRILRETGLDGHYLKLEITESCLLENAEAAAILLWQLRDRNIQLSIDDFGTGYSSLNYLHRFPVNTLKIDRSFVNRMGAGGKDAEIVKAIVALAHNLGMSVTAEGIETAQQLAQLKALQCERGQGYFFSKPVDNGAAGQLILAQLQVNS
ncbi:EAL domain-containing protein [Coleofasciculus sp. FACHB-1120]|uniref:putative bifunctional diguanylate cyclase/phosphodiesterase n=1 Tax=Coleofasciculus sp. FACHB-1120 TaxID=2692783 RepID=UPI001682CC4F|nr:EAL domain-containing protein [Coleofasciculus sp. FACHB-1120]MBD2740093.1 EAL domain-containing protein [Coleofasciculus sp. FACHB-1120]